MSSWIAPLCYPVFGDGLSEAQEHESLHVSTQLGRGMSGVREVALKREGSMSDKPWQHRNASQSPQELGLPDVRWTNWYLVISKM